MNEEEREYHEYVFLFPKMSDSQYSSLLNDIKNNGQLEPIKIDIDGNGANLQ